MRVGLACDHGGFELKESLITVLRVAGCEILDFGADSLQPDDDYPDYVVPLARAVASGEVERGIASGACGRSRTSSDPLRHVPSTASGFRSDWNRNRSRARQTEEPVLVPHLEASRREQPIICALRADLDLEPLAAHAEAEA
jgi:hypothetical protein